MNTEPQTTNIPAASTAAPASPTPPPGSHKFGRGKIAHLPPEITDDVGQMLLDGVPHCEIIRSLGELGKDLTENNISNWKQAGFKKWQADYERRAALQESRDLALGILKIQPGDELHLAATRIASAQLNEVLMKFDPTNLQAALYDNPELYFRLVDTVCRLNEGDAAAARQRAQTSLNLAKLEKEKPAPPPRIPTREELDHIGHLLHLM